MAERYADRSAAELRLSVLLGCVDARQFVTYADGTLPGRGLHAHIIGASHWLAFDLPSGVRVHEVLACEDARHDGRNAFRGSAGELPEALHLALPGGGAYAFSSRLVSGDSAARRLCAFEKRIDAARGDRAELGLRYRFRERQGSTAVPVGPFRPLTLVWARECDASRSIVVETAHAYPAERTVVFSRTEIEAAPPEVVS